VRISRSLKASNCAARKENRVKNHHVHKNANVKEKFMAMVEQVKGAFASLFAQPTALALAIA